MYFRLPKTWKFEQGGFVKDHLNNSPENLSNCAGMSVLMVRESIANISLTEHV